MKKKNYIIPIMMGILFLLQNISLLQAEVVINEIFVTPEAETDDIPQFIELYNNSSIEVDIANWYMFTYDVQGEITGPEFAIAPGFFMSVNNTKISPYGYLIIASYYHSSCENSCQFYNNLSGDIWAPFVLPSDYGKIVLSDANQNIQDQIIYDSSWPFTNGRSLRLHSPYLDNSLKGSWSSSPVTDISARLYADAGDIRNFGSPGEENAFRLFTPVDHFDHIILGDVNNIHSSHNFNDSFTFSWDGTFKDTTSQSYRLIIHKNGTEISHSNWVSIADTSIVVSPADLQVQQLEVAVYTWKVQLQRGSDVVNSDLFTLNIDANDYGIYGCVDNGNCTEGPTCPVSYNDVVYHSNYPAGCTPGVNCIRALNYDSTVNISNNTCEYISMTIPAFIQGDTGDTARIAVYLDNKNQAKLYSVDIQFSIGNTSVLSYIGSTLTGSMLESNSGYNINAPAESFLVDIDTTAGTTQPYTNSGVIAGLNMEFAGNADDNTNLVLESYTINGVSYNETNNKIISTVFLRDKFEINGHISYYDNCGSSFNSVHNVEVTLENEAGISYLDTTTSNGVYLFSGLSVGNYGIQYHKLEDISGVDYGDFHILLESFMGRTTLSENQLISGDVTLDGRLTGIDLSRLGRHIINLPVEFNSAAVEWVFIPETPINYKPLFANDKNSRTIVAYQLGDLDGNWNCASTNGRELVSEEAGQFPLTTKNGIVSLDLIQLEETSLQSFYLKLGYAANKFHTPEVHLNHTLEEFDGFEFMVNSSHNTGELYLLGWTLDNTPPPIKELGKIKMQLKSEFNVGEIWIEELIINNDNDKGAIKIGDKLVHSIQVKKQRFPQGIYLNQNFPNPFNPITQISWEMAAANKVSLVVYNLQGQFIDHLYEGKKNSGLHSLFWNAEGVPSGIYFYALTVGNETIQKKMIVLK